MLVYVSTIRVGDWVAQDGNQVQVTSVTDMGSGIICLGTTSEEDIVLEDNDVIYLYSK